MVYCFISDAFSPPFYAVLQRRLPKPFSKCTDIIIHIGKTIFFSQILYWHQSKQQIRAALVQTFLQHILHRGHSSLFLDYPRQGCAVCVKVLTKSCKCDLLAHMFTYITKDVITIVHCVALICTFRNAKNGYHIRTGVAGPHFIRGMIVNVLGCQKKLTACHLVLFFTQGENSRKGIIPLAEQMEIWVAITGTHFLIHREPDHIVIQIYIIEIGLKMKIQCFVLPASHTPCIVLGKAQHVFSVQIAFCAIQYHGQPGRFQTDDGIHGVQRFQCIGHVNQ